jgi:hypothetical protein
MSEPPIHHCDDCGRQCDGDHRTRDKILCTSCSNTHLRRELDAARDVIMAVALGDAARIDVSAYVEGRVDNVPMDPVHGGCWFCRRSGTDAFCKGWDAYYHVECLEAEKKNCPDNPELTEFP